MTATQRETAHRLPAEPTSARPRPLPGQTAVRWLTTADHKAIGNLYFITSFAWFLLGGVLAPLIRAELAAPGLQIVDNPEQYNQLFTMHGTIMLLLFATALFAGFANAIMPPQIGAPDVTCPRPKMFAYWVYPFGGLIAAAGFPHPPGRGGGRCRSCGARTRSSSCASSPTGRRPRRSASTWSPTAGTPGCNPTAPAPALPGPKGSA